MLLLLLLLLLLPFTASMCAATKHVTSFIQLNYTHTCTLQQAAIAFRMLAAVLLLLLRQPAAITHHSNPYRKI
jgi:hypothetical protein